jgi:hypothetical protein
MHGLRALPHDRNGPGARNGLLLKGLPSDAANSDRRPTMQEHPSQESDMPQRDKSARTDKQKRQAGAIEKGSGQGMARPEAGTRAWPTVNKVHGGGKKIGSGLKVPSGPVGGSGRKTNLARSS